MSYLIRGGLVADGTGGKLRRADVLVEGDSIKAVGEGLRADSVVEASGKVVSPGFIDTHSHADGGLLTNLDAETQLRQGITTAIVGQDGGHNFPLGEWFERLRQTPPALNIASFIGHGTVRGKVMGDDYKRAATASEIRKMRALVAQEVRAGGLGLSSGLEYDPGIYAKTDEVTALAELAGFYISHVRDEEEGALESFDELIQIATDAHVPAQISHIKLGSSPVWGKTHEVFARMDMAKRRGVSITADVYPYTYWQSSIIVLLTTREWDKRELWEKALAEVGGAKNILITGYAPQPAFIGKTLAQVAAEQKKDPVTLTMELVKAANGAVGVVVTAMQERDLHAFLRHPEIMFCTDGGLRGSHPRGAGSYPRILGKYVREERVLSLEEAIRKASALPASRFGFTDRGVIAPGKKADLVLFDPKTIHDTATTKDPQAKPVGLTDVLVNGVPVLRNSQLTGSHPGRVLKPISDRIGYAK
ncbi:N-acyl-D-amino-acid deacylase family protein [Armatimonas rosea]|uniref:N-acyl-D-amino-acid deacylase n=1 Tax=Armatimonas rosea TaxID=685828 RepID=A0A7W9SNL0_ARMRO|nr:D-aminoacylase [Armatimonas rosea]MBB6049927.1 N-acyl-D-amino-acid deacylase [Armatimonas rosea]